jgi:Zn-finger nucleic acid-binding protein
MSPEARTLRCPHCGAAADPDARRCPYCRARLAMVSCPSCFAQVFSGTRHCHACGTAVARGEAVPERATCPACRGAMDGVTIGATPLLECPACDGVWVDAKTFETLCADREAQAPVLHHLAPRGSLPARQPVRYRPCVTCGAMMNRLNFGRLSGTIVDVCRGHGTFLDAGELHAILTFIQGGGLDRARARELNELQEERRRLEQARIRTSASGGRGAAESARPTRTSWDARSLLDLLGRMKGRGASS